MPQGNETRIYELCRQAMSEEDVYKLLNIFLELDYEASLGAVDGIVFTRAPEYAGRPASA